MELNNKDTHTIRGCVVNLARKFGVSQENWEDLTQDVVLYVLENINTYDNSRNWNAWLYTVSRTSTLRFVMQYKIPVAIPKSTWQRQTANLKNMPVPIDLHEVLNKGYDATIVRLFVERTGMSTGFNSDAGYIYKDTMAKMSPYKLYTEAIEETDILTQLKTIAKIQHPNIDWWFENWLDSPRTLEEEDREKILNTLQEEICRKPKV